MYHQAFSLRRNITLFIKEKNKFFSIYREKMSDNSKYIISEFYDFKADRNLIIEAEQANKPIKLKGILQKADTQNRNGRVYPFDILKREADNYMQAVKERRALGECVPAGTGIFTENGWKNIEDVEEFEKIFTLNIESGELELQYVTNKIEKFYKDDMIHIFNNSKLDMLVTKKHKIVIWDMKNNPFVLTAEELYNKIQKGDKSISKCYIKNSGNWEGEYSEFFNLPNTNINIKIEDWAAFLGIFISEGHCSGTKGGEKRNVVCITQKKEEQKNRLIELLDKLPFDYFISDNRQFIINNDALYKHLFNLGNSYEKHIPEYAKKWNSNLLNILLEWLLIGDGKNRNIRGKKIREYYTTSYKLANDVSEIMLKISNGATITERVQKDRYINDEKTIGKNGVLELVKTKRLIKKENSKKLYTVHEKTSKSIYLDLRYTKAEKVPFNDYVFCVSVPNKTWLMKYNNSISWTHNCDHPESPIVSLSNASHLVTNMWWEGETLMGEVELVETEAGNKLKGLLKSGVMLGISSRGVGSVKSVSGRDVVQSDFELIAFDFVSSPSTPGAYMFKESRQWGLTKLTDANYKAKNNNENLSQIQSKIISLSKDNYWDL